MKKLFLKVSILAVLLASLSSCHTQRSVLSDKGVYGYDSSNKRKGTSHFFIGGIGQTDNIDAIEICGGENNVEAVETRLPFLHGLVSGLTLSIYSPREYTVYCK